MKSKVYNYIDRQFIQILNDLDGEECSILLGFIECAKMVDVINNDEYEFLTKCVDVIRKDEYMLKNAQQESLVRSASLLHMLNNL